MADGDPWAVYERLTAKDQGRLTPAERRLLALGGLRAEVNNGGFHQYFFNSAGDLATDALDAAQVADADDLISLIRRALSILNVPDPSDRLARQDALSKLGPEQFADIDDSYYAVEASADLDAVMRAVMRKA
jgi:Domain of unknown function (DUF4375)